MGVGPEMLSCVSSIQDIGPVSELNVSFEEADVKLIPHALHAVKHGSTRIVLLSNDTDVTVLAPGLRSCMVHCPTLTARITGCPTPTPEFAGRPTPTPTTQNPPTPKPTPTKILRLLIRLRILELLGVRLRLQLQLPKILRLLPTPTPTLQPCMAHFHGKE